MEAARPLTFGRRRDHQLERELQSLRPFGEAYVMKHFGDRLALADAEDAISDVTLRIHRQIADGRPPDNLQAAFLTGCRNAAIDRLRRRARKPTVALEAAADTPTSQPALEELAEHREASSRVREVLARTSPRQRQVLILRFGLGLTVPEIAAQMNLSLPAAKNLLARGIEQARRRMEAIDSQRFCPEVQDRLHTAVVDKDLAGLASEDERRELDAHLDHCGTCKSFLASLHRDFNQIGSGALLGASTTQHRAFVHLGGWFDHATNAIHAGIAKARLTAYRLTGPFNGDASGAGGALAGTGQKVVAICGAATATTATCLATGLVGPGVGVLDHHHSDPAASHHQARGAQVRRFSDLPPVSPAPGPEPEPSPQAEPTPTTGSEQKATEQAPPPEPAPEPTPTPTEQGAEEFGVESSSAPPEQQPPPEPAPAPPSSPSRAAGGGGGGGGESFGFGG